MISPSDAVDAATARFHPKRPARALHAKGVWLRGTFIASDAARDLTRAAHLQGGAVPVLARMSNGSGDPDSRDFEPDVRGLAVSFELPDGSTTDLLGQSVPKFFSPTPDHFVDLLKANTGPLASLKFPLFLLRRPQALGDLPGNAKALAPISSYAACRYFTVHAFRWENAAGAVSHVRCDWVPEADDARLSGGAAKALGPDYLAPEIAERVAAGPVRFTLEAQIAEGGDNVQNPAAHWPSSRQRVALGTLELTAVVDDPEVDGAIRVFDPMRLTDGIASSGDPVLEYRPGAYSESAARR